MGNDENAEKCTISIYLSSDRSINCRPKIDSSASVEIVNARHLFTWPSSAHDEILSLPGVMAESCKFNQIA
jgi:hypothetical protein